MEDILTVLPFGGTFDLVEIKGSTVKKAFEHAVHRYGSKSGEFLQVSGLFSGSFSFCHVCTFDLGSSTLTFFSFVASRKQRCRTFATS